ncbi:hypothetical protein BKA70DRAFT_1310220 [Coprinopsis sp. MPI-PUGE-AT-0042]|nr:hypothetical protein BKA70DRAFT_1310220 [Coprinopsis sp. MPI-PUGE-AT-0042]
MLFTRSIATAFTVVSLFLSLAHAAPVASEAEFDVQLVRRDYNSCMKDCVGNMVVTQRFLAKCQSKCAAQAKAEEEAAQKAAKKKPFWKKK